MDAAMPKAAMASCWAVRVSDWRLHRTMVSTNRRVSSLVFPGGTSTTYDSTTRVTRGAPAATVDATSATPILHAVKCWSVDPCVEQIYAFIDMDGTYLLLL